MTRWGGWGKNDISEEKKIRDQDELKDEGPYMFRISQCFLLTTIFSILILYNDNMW